VSDPQVHERVCGEIAAFLEGEGWRVLGVTESPVEGGDGNREFLVGAVKGQAFHIPQAHFTRA
jgi:23S rRNA (cytidine1920-2'-O)/16S rRNA (cytidine1409-2'-O)-methyltransferase